MRIADIDRAGLAEGLPADRHDGGAHAIGERDRLPVEARFAHVDACASADGFDRDHAARCLHPRGSAMKQRDCAAGIAAGADLGAVLVEDAHAEVGGFACLEQDQLVAANPRPAIGQCAGNGRVDRGEGTRAGVEHDEVVTQAVHLDEIDTHRAAHLCTRRRSVQCRVSRRACYPAR